MRTLRSWTLGMLLAAASLVAVSCGGAGGTGKAPPTLEPVRVDAPIGAGPSPSALAVGGGAVWVVDGAASTLTRVDVRSRRAGRPVRLSGGPFAVAVGEGAAWVAAGDGTVSSFDLRTGRPTGRPVRVRGANGIAVGAGGVWVTSRIARTVTRVDPRTRRAGRPLTVGRGPADVAVGAGAVWVLNADEGTVSRIDPGNDRVGRPIAVGAPQARALAVGDGGVWVARAGGEFGDRLEVVRIDPEDRELEGDPVPVSGAVPLDLVVAGGAVWATDAGDLRRSGEARGGGVTRIDPERRRAAGRPIRTGERPSAVAAGEGAVWVANTAGGTIVALRTT
jgi:virginiamycin B lyase